MDEKQTGVPRDLHDYVVQHPDATVFLQAKNDGLPDAGVFPGDVLVVDLVLTPSAGDVAVVIVGEEFRIQQWEQSGYVVAWGVVTYVLHARR